MGSEGRAELARYRQLNLALRPEEELFDLRDDPYQVRNVAADPRHAAAKAELRRRVLAWMRATGDPRVNPAYDGWDTMPYFGPTLREVEQKAREKQAKTRAK